MPELKRRRRAASEPDADSADATQEYSPYVPTFQSARPGSSGRADWNVGT